MKKCRIESRTLQRFPSCAVKVLKKAMMAEAKAIKKCMSVAKPKNLE